eukprot:CAMPEP_0174821464 /NCGR_PEP_ID=MMETSP1107-20130205/8428_1 /TAXON_ID=36770 /ORGANISM="Paraphysomonas vestita, Strain GFlagA" /LENGTH=436 /DNA_ID=CAMNT_0016038531 /DNA_START=46 /DNA_END=1353 /DNA_ORIENTATION=+
MANLVKKVTKKGLVTPPLIPTLSAYKSPATRVTPLAGLRVATQSFDAELATIGVRVNVGSRDDVKNGTANFLNRLTKRKLASQLGNSAKITSYSNREHTVYTLSVLKEDAKNALSVLQEAIRNPGFDAQTVEAERASLVTELEGLETQYQERIFQHLHRTAFMDSSLGNAPEGTVESVKSITATDLQNFLNQHVVKKNVVVVGTGPVDHEDLVQVTSDGFSSLGDSKAQQSKSAVFVGSDIQFRFDSMREAHVVLAFETAPSHAEEALTFRLIESIIGSWNVASFGSENSASRLAQELQESQSANSFEAFNFSYRDTGLFGVKLAAEPRHLEEAIYFLTYNLARLSHDVSEEEVERAKNQLKTKLLLNLGNTEHAANDIGWQLLSYGRRVPSAEVASRIDSLTLGDVESTARNYLKDEDHALAAVGPIFGLPDYNW